jgi:hypothetical protein
MGQPQRIAIKADGSDQALLRRIGPGADQGGAEMRAVPGQAAGHRHKRAECCGQPLDQRAAIHPQPVRQHEDARQVRPGQGLAQRGAAGARAVRCATRLDRQAQPGGAEGQREGGYAVILHLLATDLAAGAAAQHQGAGMRGLQFAVPRAVRQSVPRAEIEHQPRRIAHGFGALPTGGRGPDLFLAAHAHPPPARPRVRARRMRPRG